MTGFFITATGTDIGKTLVTASLSWQLGQLGRAVQAIKPIVTGFDENCWQESDTAHLLNACGKPLTQEMIDKVSPWRYSRPVSPHLAAELDIKKIENFCCKSYAFPGITLIEGAGGIMTPLTYRYTQLDLLERLAIPAIIVTGTYLGTISHTLTALLAVQTRNIPLAAIIVNESLNSGSNIDELTETLAGFVSVPIVYLPRLSDKQPLWKYAPSLLKAIGL